MSTFPQLELHRRGIGLVPAPGTSESAIRVAMDKARPLYSCTCKASKRKTCEHLQALSRELGEYRKRFRRRDWEAFFSATVWHRLAKLLFDAQGVACTDVRVAQLRAESPEDVLDD